MSSVIKLEIKNNNDNDNGKTNLHYMPFKVEPDERTNERINIEKCFEAYTEEVDGVLTNSVRGYPIKGCEMNVPPNYKGIIFNEKRRPLNEDEDRTFTSSTMFDKFTYWNYDKIPSVNDPLRKAYDWIDIAETLHAPVDIDEFNLYLQSQEEEKKEGSNDSPNAKQES